MPALGLGAPDRAWARFQPYLYAGGQWLHIVGLLWSGGYGTPRKVAGAAQGLERVEQIAAMGIMGVGGAIAVIGGALFLVIVLRAAAGSLAFTGFVRHPLVRATAGLLVIAFGLEMLAMLALSPGGHAGHALPVAVASPHHHAEPG